MAEGKLFKAVQGEDLQAVKYLLSTKGKRRGYTERQEISGPEGGPIQTQSNIIRIVTHDGSDSA